jgi:hypothetical protein
MNSRRRSCWASGRACWNGTPAGTGRTTSRLKDIPCLVPQKLYEGTNAGSFYLYAMSYHKEHLNGIDRATFLKALNAEGVSLSPYNRQGLHRARIEKHLKTKVYQTMYSPAAAAVPRGECVPQV